MGAPRPLLGFIWLQGPHRAFCLVCSWLSIRQAWDERLGGTWGLQCPSHPLRGDGVCSIHGCCLWLKLPIRSF